MARTNRRGGPAVGAPGGGEWGAGQSGPTLPASHAARRAGALAVAAAKPGAALVRISNRVSVSKTRMAPMSRLVTPPSRHSSGTSHFGSALARRPTAMRNCTKSSPSGWRASRGAAGIGGGVGVSASGGGRRLRYRRSSPAATCSGVWLASSALGLRALLALGGCEQRVVQQTLPIRAGGFPPHPGPPTKWRAPGPRSAPVRPGVASDAAPAARTRPCAPPARSGHCDATASPGWSAGRHAPPGPAPAGQGPGRPHRCTPPPGRGRRAGRRAPRCGRAGSARPRASRRRTRAPPARDGSRLVVSRVAQNTSAAPASYQRSVLTSAAQRLVRRHRQRAILDIAMRLAAVHRVNAQGIALIPPGQRGDVVRDGWRKTIGCGARPGRRPG